MKVWEDHPKGQPRPQDMRPGYVFTDMGSTIELHEGKHGNGDLRVVLNGRAISFRVLCVLITALYVSEERYRAKNPHAKGGEYLVAYMGAWVHWIRSHLGHESPSFSVFKHTK